jgi:predicted glycoside hydrolase/deacetylase ChbG (UPF0249 family)
VSTLAESLGYRADDRVLLLSCDDLGFSHAANVAVFDALHSGAASSAALMIPAPWAREAAARYRGEDVGVHLTINSEHDLYRWGPITQSPSLLDGDGGFPRTVADVWEHADLDEVRREWRAQVERAVYWGFDVSHLNVHLADVVLRPEFFDVLVDLAEDFCLPVRLPGAKEQARAGFPFRDLAGARGVLAPDHLLEPGPEAPTAARLAELVARLEPGVTELHLHPALDTPELRAATPDWPRRVAEHAALADRSLVAAIRDEGVERTSYRRLRALMRERRASAQAASGDPPRELPAAAPRAEPAAVAAPIAADRPS